MTPKAVALANVESELRRSRVVAHLRLTAVAHDDDTAVHHAFRALRLGAEPATVARMLAGHCDLHGEQQ